MWDFLGDWIIPHGSESKGTSPENLLFNNCYLRYITLLTSKVAAVLGKDADSKKYAAAADAQAAAINAAFFNASSGVYLSKIMQTWQVMPLAAGVVPEASVDKAFGNLQHSIDVLQKGHLDTGLTGTYFMTKLLTDLGRNDLIFTMTNQTTFPSYGYFLEQGFTTWPESWTSKGGVTSPDSKMHGCYNAIGLWFLQGIAGVAVDATNKEHSVTVRASVDSGDIDSASGSRFALYGTAKSSWAFTFTPNPSAASSSFDYSFAHNVTLPGNGVAKVMIPSHDAKGNDVKEGGKVVNTGGVAGVKAVGMESVNDIRYLAMTVGSGSYQFTSD